MQMVHHSFSSASTYTLDEGSAMVHTCTKKPETLALPFYSH